MNLFDLTGMKALVTGAGSPQGLGRAMAQALRDQGAEVAVLSRSARIFDVAREDGHYGIQADLADRGALRRAFDEALGHLGTLDILINAHGVSTTRPAASFAIADWDKILETNLTSVFILCQLAAGVMGLKGYGKIINVASMTTFFGSTQCPAYTASKGGIGQLTRALANEWAIKGINVNAIAPGYIDTELIADAMADDAWRQGVFARIPAGRFGLAGDMKGIAIFLASHASDYVDGAIIPVDGGYLGR
jgi:2-deoxy-D-gluconate 3-dehydrogenase